MRRTDRRDAGPDHRYAPFRAESSLYPERRIDVFLPRHYDSNDHRYPVLLLERQADGVFQASEWGSMLGHCQHGGHPLRTAINPRIDRRRGLSCESCAGIYPRALEGPRLLRLGVLCTECGAEDQTRLLAAKINQIRQRPSLCG
jgi:hypothetical protein